ncbi:MAG: hypothetical protein ACPLKP_00585 [Microgenomates group bacterium]
MIKKISLVIFLIIFLGFPKEVFAGLEANHSAKLANKENEKKVDFRASSLEKFLKQYRSPLAKYASVFVETADKYQIDWRLVPAITGVESSFGKHIPFGSYNAYGWNNGNYYFSSWEESIEIVTKTLKEKYINRGLDTPQKIAPVYAPPSSTWGSKVNYFIKKIQGVYEKIEFANLNLN